ncbi:MAG: hypothetical protein KJ882_04330 [Proteobacteria bacterium]|nr:hypothetical protein [Pseudomonadota bacterium]
MEKSKKEKPGIEKAGEDLFNFAINREDLKLIMSLLPEEAYIKRETVEYELQILKFISTGWGITIFLRTPHIRIDLQSCIGKRFISIRKTYLKQLIL